jgi:hypothetical protein
VTRAQLTTILLYLRNAHAFIDSAHYVARSAKDDSTAAMLAELRRHAHTDIIAIQDMRDRLEPKPAR